MATLPGKGLSRDKASMTKLSMTAIAISTFFVKCCVSFNSTAQLHNHIDNHQTELCVVNLLNRLNKLSQKKL